MREIDCRGLACPQPVLKVKDALDGMESGQIRVIVDNEGAVGNVSRFARSQGCQVETAPLGSDFAVTIVKNAVQKPTTGSTCECPAPGEVKPKLVVKISDSTMGRGDDALGRILMKAFLKSLKDASLKPEAMVFYNSGVKLTVNGSEHLGDLQALEEAGVKVFSCGTCLDFFGIKNDLAVGAVTNMFEIVETLSTADRVVAP